MRGWIGAAAVGVMLAACGEQAAVPHVPEPKPEPVAVPQAQNEWSVVSGRYPALTFSPKGQTEFSIGCEEAVIKVATRAFEPVQAWPQPQLELIVGGLRYSVVPDARNIANQVQLEIQFENAREFMDGLDQAESVQVRFDGETKTYELDPDMTDRWLGACRDSAPPWVSGPNAG